ncbi:MAG TPA: hypothetical protein VK999_04610 [Methylotenera sp.]|nr:hypothetical protein [Methylotenera sp.]
MLILAWLEIDCMGVLLRCAALKILMYFVYILVAAFRAPLAYEPVFGFPN